MSHTETQSLAPKFPGRVVTICFPEGFCLVSGRDPHVCGNVHGSKARFLSAHGHGHGHGRAAEGKGATGRDEAERKGTRAG